MVSQVEGTAIVLLAGNDYRLTRENETDRLTLCSSFREVFTQIRCLSKARKSSKASTVIVASASNDICFLSSFSLFVFYLHFA